MPYVTSTLTNNTRYVEYAPLMNERAPTNDIIRQVIVKGGANRADKRLHTPRGVATFITEEDAEFLSRNKAFLLHEKKGFVTLTDRKVNPERVAADLNPKDGCAPRTPEDSKPEDIAQPSEANRKEVDFRDKPEKIIVSDSTEYEADEDGIEDEAPKDKGKRGRPRKWPVGDTAA